MRGCPLTLALSHKGRGDLSLNARGHLPLHIFRTAIYTEA